MDLINPVESINNAAFLRSNYVDRKQKSYNPTIHYIEEMLIGYYLTLKIFSEEKCLWVNKKLLVVIKLLSEYIQYLS